jgi:hypothetical protein
MRVRSFSFTTLALAGSALIGCSATPSRPSAVPTHRTESSALPLRRIHLYETGVGYFERAGKLRPGQDLLSLPAAHVDDALKTLVILSDGAPVVVGAIEFESVLSNALARVQAGLPSDTEQQLTYPALLESLRGVKVEVLELGGKRIEGRLVEVAEIKAPIAPKPSADAAKSPGASEKAEAEEGESAASSGHAPVTTGDPKPRMTRYVITLVEPNGGITRFDSAQIRSLRPLETNIAGRLDSAVATATNRGAQALRKLKLAATGNVPIRIGYVTETPVWRVTYRLVLGKVEADTLLQGWVLVHNDTDEAWQGVELQIVNGRPDSFLFPLTAPRYLRRQLNTPADEMSTLPQLARKTPDQIWGDRVGEAWSDEIGESFGAGGLGLSGIGAGGEGHGVGITFGEPSTTNEISVGNLASLAPSDGMPSGANFRYRIAQPITLSAHSSALVPLTQIHVESELLTRFAWDSPQGRVSVHITNRSGQTLPAGPIAIYNPEGLAGESTLTRLASGQRSWLTYGMDLDTRVEFPATDVERNTTKLLRFEDGQRLVEHYVHHRERQLHLTNRSTLKRQICIDLPIGSNAQVVGADRLQFDPTSAKPLGIFELLPRTELDRTLVLDEGLQKSTPLSELAESKLSDLLHNTDLDPSARGVLTDAVGFLKKRAGRHRQLDQLKQQLDRLEADRGRLESTLEKLKNTQGRGAEPLVRRVVEIEVARHRIETQQKALMDAQAAELPELGRILGRLNPSPAVAPTAKPKTAAK